MSREQITPLPWKLRHVESSICGEIVEVVGDDGRTIADSEPYYPHAIGDANAAYIVRACNAYPTLLEALEHSMSGNTRDGVACPFCGSRKAFCWFKATRAAIEQGGEG